MNINIEIDRETNPTDLSAIIALCLALGGTIPTAHVDAALRAPDNANDGALPAAVPNPPVASSEPLAPLPPVVVAPPPPVSNGAASASSIKRDARGLPWDERIHAPSKSITGKGEWMKRKRLADGYYEQIAAELLAGNAPPPPSTDGAEPLAPVVITSEPAVAINAVERVAPPPPVVTAAAPPPPSTDAAPAKLTFPQLVAKCNAKFGDDPNVFAKLDEMAQGIGLENFKALLKQPDMIPYFETLLAD